jgi:hypothetical protein
MRPLFWPYVVGSMLGAVTLGLLAFWVTRGFLEARHKHVLEARLKAKH